MHLILNYNLPRDVLPILYLNLLFVTKICRPNYYLVWTNGNKNEIPLDF